MYFLAIFACVYSLQLQNPNRMKINISILFLCYCYTLTAQITDSLYNNKSYTQAIDKYKSMVATSAKPRIEYYNIASCFSYLNERDSAIYYLKKSIKADLKYNSLAAIATDKKFSVIRTYSEWSGLEKQIIKNTKKFIADKNKCKYPSLKRELARREASDQKYRKIKLPENKQKRDAILAFQNQIDVKNTAWLKQKIKKYGWLGIREVGETGDNTAWLLVQHADRDTAFQIKILDLLREQVKINNTNKMNCAYLTDRVLVNTQQKQIYSTQVKEVKKDSLGVAIDVEFQPLLYPDKVDSLRAEMNLPSQAIYKKGFLQYQNAKK